VAKCLLLFTLDSYVGDMCICRQFLANIALTKPTANHHAAAEEEEDRQWHYSCGSIGRRRGGIGACR
jgi:hypothetical protein